MFAFRLLILSVAAWAAAMLTTANADVITIDLVDLQPNEAEMEWGGDHNPGVVTRGSRDLELGYDRARGYDGSNEEAPKRVGLRYLNMNIPAGSTINSAYIQFQADQVDKTIFTPNNDPELGTLDPLVASVSIYGYLDPVTPANSPALSPQSGVIGPFNTPDPDTLYTMTDRTGGQCGTPGPGQCALGQGPLGGVGSDITNVTAPVHWEDIPTWSTGDVNGNGVVDPGDWVGIEGTAGLDQRTPNLASIVQQIVDLPGWAANNAISFLIDPMAVKDPNGDFDADDDVDGHDFLEWQRDDLPVPVNEHDFEITRAHWMDSWEQNYGTLDPPTGDDVFFQGNRTAISLNCAGNEDSCEVPGVTWAAPSLTIDFTPPAPIGAASVAIPEPATGITLLIGMVSMFFRRNRRMS